MSLLVQWFLDLGSVDQKIEEYGSGKINTNLPVFSFAKEGIKKKEWKSLLTRHFIKNRTQYQNKRQPISRKLEPYMHTRRYMFLILIFT